MATRALSFAAVYEEFHPRVLRYLRGFVDADEAADLAQVTMIKASEHIAGFRGESSLATWIYRIATHVALDRLRQRSGQPLEFTAEREEDDDDACDRNVPPELRAPSTESAAIREEMSGCLREFVDRLAPNYRSILILGEIEGLTNAEIAQATGLTVDTVKIRLHRARRKLRAELEAGCRLEHDEHSALVCDRKARSK